MIQLLYFDNLEHIDGSQNQPRKMKEIKVCDEILF